MSTKYILSRRTCFVTNKLILFHAVRSLCSYITHSVPPPPFDIHDDVIKWKHFRVTGPLCGEFTAPGEFPSQRPMTRSFYGFFDLHLNKQLNKQSRGWWFETLSRSLWRHRNVSWVTPEFAPLFTMALNSSPGLPRHLNTLRPRQNGRHFADDTFKLIFVNENVRISIQNFTEICSQGSY